MNEGIVDQRKIETQINETRFNIFLFSPQFHQTISLDYVLSEKFIFSKSARWFSSEISSDA